MRKLAIIAVFLASTANAQEVTTVVTTPTETVAAVAPIPALVDAVAAVCANFNLSPKAIAACNDDAAWPRVTNDGTRFRNTGIGAEFNALIANLDKVK